MATIEDVRRVAPLALAHRRRRSPFDDPGIEQDEIDRALDTAPPPDRVRRRPGRRCGSRDGEAQAAGASGRPDAGRAAQRYREPN